MSDKRCSKAGEKFNVEGELMKQSRSASGAKPRIAIFSGGVSPHRSSNVLRQNKILSVSMNQLRLFCIAALFLDEKIELNLHHLCHRIRD
ncbi:hypothetical protein [Paraglaciecola chathamensis]|uniref:hypothetical protein n=1 Tax=Paraglaciecola chathamensis TaxID=368405 RepID=UPI0026FD0186|nr:hypothetical protein [Paraglaciecola chathamensis]MDO6559663.1 hypothetical protein [Paraglaciecola chathamensis]